MFSQSKVARFLHLHSQIVNIRYQHANTYFIWKQVKLTHQIRKHKKLIKHPKNY